MIYIGQNVMLYKSYIQSLYAGFSDIPISHNFIIIKLFKGPARWSSIYKVCKQEDLNLDPQLHIKAGHGPALFSTRVPASGSQERHITKTLPQLYFMSFHIAIIPTRMEMK